MIEVSFNTVFAFPLNYKQFNSITSNRNHHGYERKERIQTCFTSVLRSYCRYDKTIVKLRNSSFFSD